MSPLSPQTTPANRRRLWPIVLIFALGNLAAWLAWAGPGSPSGRLSVTATTPTGDGEVPARAAFTWRFNRPVAEPTARVAAGAEPGAIVPAVPGVWSWRDARTLVFTPSDPLPLATGFALTLASERLIARDGATLAAAVVRRVHTAPLRLEQAFQAGVEAGERYRIDIRFNDRVDPQRALTHLTLADAAGAAIAVEALPQADDGRVLRLRTEALAGRTLTALAATWLDLSPGLTGTSGPLGLITGQRHEITLGGALRLNAARASSWAWEDRRRIHLEFSAGVDRDLLKRLLVVEPAVDYTIGDLQATGAAWHSSSSATLVGAFAHGERYRVGLRPGATADGRPVRAGALPVTIPDREAGVWFDRPQGGVLGAAGARRVRAWAVNLRALTLTVSRHHDDTLVAWQLAGDRDRHQGVGSAQGPVIAIRTLALAGRHNVVEELQFDLDDLLPAGVAAEGVYRLHLGAEAADVLGETDRWSTPAAAVVVTLSDLGLAARCGGDDAVVWVASLSRGEPVAGVRVRLYSDKRQLLGTATSDADGLTRFPALIPATGERAALAVADRAGDTAWLRLDGSLRDAGADLGGRPVLRRGYEAFVSAERGIFRPGETAHLRALVRGPEGARPPAFPVRWLVLRPDGKVWREQIATLDGDGATAWDLDLPSELPTGAWPVRLCLPGADGAQLGLATLAVEDFVPQRLVVTTALTGGATRIQLPTTARAEVRADHRLGGPAAGYAARLSVRVEALTPAPAGWRDWSFGLTKDDAAALDRAPSPARRQELTGQALDADGRAAWDLPLAELVPAGEPGPWRLILSGAVAEAGGRAVEATTTIDLHASPRLIALRPAADGIATVGQPWRLACALVAADGGAVADDTTVSVRLYREAWDNTLEQRAGWYAYHSRRRLVAHGATTTATLIAGRGEIILTPPDGGRWLALIEDGAAAATGVAFSAGSPDGWSDPIARERPERVQVEVAPVGGDGALRRGGEARVLVRAPFPGRLLLTVESDRVLATRVLTLDQGQGEVVLPVGPDWPGTVYVSACVVRPVQSGRPWRVHRAFGTAAASVDQPGRHLDIAVQAPATVRPGGTLDLAVRVTDAAGAPAADAPVWLAAVDEGVLAITRFATPDPNAVFLGRRAWGVTADDAWTALMPEVLAPAEPGGDAGVELDRHVTPVVAKRFRPVALVASPTRTNSDGIARVQLTVPQSFAGTLRAMAFACAGPACGAGQAPVPVRAPLMAQVGLPRFAAPGDRFTATVTVFNRTGAAGRAVITAGCPTGDPLTLVGGPATLHLADGGEGDVAIPLAAADRVGVARLAVAVELGGERWEETIELPVRPAAPMQDRGGDVVIPAGGSVALAVPSDWLSGAGAVVVQAGGEPHLGLPRALDHLDRYPYGCCEQTVSTAFPLLALADLGDRIAPGAYDRAAIRDRIAHAIARIATLTAPEGGCSDWGGWRPAWPWATVYAAHFLHEAGRAGHEVPPWLRERLLHYCRGLLASAGAPGTAHECQAYAAYVLTLAGQPDPGALERLAAVAGDPGTPATTGFLVAAAWLAAGDPKRAAAILPAELPALRSARETGDSIGSPLRDQALVLNTLLAVKPDHAVIPRLARQVAAALSGDRWLTTQETAFATLALGSYLRAQPRRVPPTALDLRQGDTVLAHSDGTAPLAWRGPAPAAGDAPLRLHVTGPAGCLVDACWLQHGVPLTPPPAADEGLVVRRRYLDAQGQALARPPRQGDAVLVELTVSSAQPHRNVVIEDLLPAGLEIEDPRADYQPDPADQGALDRCDARDDRLVLFLDLIRDSAGDAPHGRYRAVRRYLARAVTIGDYALPPVRAECLYDASIRSLHGGGRFSVLAR